MLSRASQVSTGQKQAWRMLLHEMRTTEGITVWHCIAQGAGLLLTGANPLALVMLALAPHCSRISMAFS